MSYEDRIREERSDMSKSFAKLADFLLDSYIESAFMTASELAQALDLDAATVVRFSQSLKYAGYPELQREIRERVKKELLIRPVEASDPFSVTGIASKAMDEVGLALEKTRISLDMESVAKLAEMIGKARRIVVMAEGPTQPTAYSLVLYLEQGGFPVYISRPGIADLARTVNISGSQDLLLAMEVAGQAPYIAQALKAAQIKGIPTASIVGAASLASARFADTVLSAQAHPGIGVGIVSLEAVVYALSQVLRWRFPDHYSGSEQAITNFVRQIQQPLD